VNGAAAPRSSTDAVRPTSCAPVFYLAQSSTIIGDWPAKNGIQRGSRRWTSEYAPGKRRAQFLQAEFFIAGCGEIGVEAVKVAPWPTPTSNLLLAR